MLPSDSCSYTITTHDRQLVEESLASNSQMGPTLLVIVAKSVVCMGFLYSISEPCTIVRQNLPASERRAAFCLGETANPQVKRLPCLRKTPNFHLLESLLLLQRFNQARVEFICCPRLTFSLSVFHVFFVGNCRLSWPGSS